MNIDKYKQVLKKELQSLPDGEDRLQFWRKKIYHFLTLGCLFFGLVAYVPSVLLSMREGLWAIAFVDTAVYCLIVFLHFNKSLSFDFKVYGLLAIIHFLGISLLLLVDAVHSGLIYLFTLPIVAGVLLNFRSTLVAVSINAFSVLVLGFLLKYGLLDHSAMHRFAFSSWTVMSINFICLNFMTSIPISILINGLRFSVEEEKKSKELLWNAQLQMFQQQINPHFLFNTLNSLRSLITQDSDKARGMVTDLSDFLRLTLSSYKTVSSTVKEEIEMAQRYLHIQQIRFESDLVYTTHVQPEAENFKVPTFLLQPLVENAVKFGMMTSPMPFHLNVEVKRTKEAVLIHVVNSGNLVPAKTENHCNHGLANIKARLELMFPGKSTFELTEKKGHVHVEISIWRDDLDV